MRTGASVGLYVRAVLNISANGGARLLSLHPHRFTPIELLDGIIIHMVWKDFFHCASATSLIRTPTH